MFMISFCRKNLCGYLLTLFSLFGCEPHNNVSNFNIPPTCIETQTTCSVINDFGQFTLLLDVKQLVSETPFNYYLSYQGNYSVVSAQGYLEGQNMYMGKIPVFFESLTQDNTWKGSGLLGSCSEDIMYWDLYVLVTLKHLTTGQETTQKIKFSFSSHRF